MVYVLRGLSLMSWKSKKLEHTSKSSAEAKYKSMLAVCYEIVWLRRLLKEHSASLHSPITLYVDNFSAIHIALNPIFHEHTKNIEVNYHYIKELIQDCIISLTQV